MDVASLAAGLVAARTGQVQIAVAASMMKMNAEAAASVVKLIDSAQASMDQLANVAAGIGTNLDITV